VKSLSFHQPRAEQIIRGEKTVDVRTWQTKYRGPLAIHAAQKRRATRCRDLGFDPDILDYGAVIGVVEVVEIRPLDAEAYAALQPQHRLDTPFPGAPCYAWILANPQRLPSPLPVTGRRRLFEVDLSQRESEKARKREGEKARGREGEKASRIPVSGSRQPVYHATPLPQPDPARPFALYTLPEAGEGYRVALHQWVPVGQTFQSVTVTQAGKPTLPGVLWSIEVGGDTLRAVTDHLLATLRTNGYKATDLARAVGSETPFYLDEPSGLRLALILLAVKPLTRHDRIEAIGQGIQAMSAEETYYWFSKCTAGPDALRAQKALRVLLAEE